MGWSDGNLAAVGSTSSLSCNPSSDGFSITNSYVRGLNGEQVSETDGAGHWYHTNVFANGQLLATYGASETYFALNDWLGTKRAEVTPDGGLATFASLPFGNDLTTAGNLPDATEQHYTGKEHDSRSGNDYFGARYYANSVGRWLTPDPLGDQVADLSSPQTWNMYTYALNDPLNFKDPTGLYCYYAPDPGQDPNDSSLFDFHSSKGECRRSGGRWFDDPTTTVTVNGSTGDSNLVAVYTGNYGSIPYVTTQTQSFQGSFYDCVRGGLNGFSLQRGLQKISGGKLGNGWISGALLGNSIQSVGDTIQLLSSGHPGAAGNTAATEASSWVAGPAATAAASKVPNVTVTVGVQAATTVQTPASSTTIAIGAQATADLPLGTVSQTGAGALSDTLDVIGTFKLPYDLSVASFSTVVCGLYY